MNTRVSTTAPIIIGGAARSGTTLLRAMLDCHPSICCGPELKILSRVADMYRFMTTAAPTVLAAYKLSNAEFAAQLRQLVESMVTPLRLSTGKLRWGEKTPVNILHFAELAEVFPDGRFIHVVRDGRDVTCSLVTMDWNRPGGTEKLEFVQNMSNAAAYWNQAVRSGLHAATLPKLAGRILLVRYEQLVNNAEATLREVLNFVGEAWDPAVLDYHQKNREDEPIEASTPQIARPVYRSSIGRWKMDMSPADKAAFKAQAGELLAELGYAPAPW